MKKSLLLLASMLVSAVSFAQWTKPVPTAQDMTLNDTVYLYNVEAGGFLKGANDWNTRASVASDGYKVIIKTAYEDEEETVPTGHYWICDSVETQSAVKAMFADNAQSIWVDNLAGANVDQWDITKLDNGYYQITNFGCYDPTTAVCPLGVAEYYQGATGNTRLWLYDTSLTYDHEVDGETMTDPVFSGNFYSNWIFVSPAEYAAFQPKVAQYAAAMALNSAIESAEAAYGSKIDLSAPKAVYNNTASTTEELEAATAKVQEIINDYNASQASYDDPMVYDIGDGSDIAPWTREFTGDGEVGTWHTNSWSTEGQTDGTDMLINFCEDWVASGGILSDQKIYQTLTGATPGLYKLTIDARVYSEAGKLDKFEGIKMFFGTESVDLQEQVDIYYSSGKSVLWNKDYFTIITVLKEAGDIQFGFDIKDANFNWLAFKNTSLKYYGNENVEENKVKLIKSSYSFVNPEDIDANPELVETYKTALDAFNAATDPDEIKAAAKDATNTYMVVKANADAYVTLLGRIETWEKSLSDHQDLAGEYWDAFSDFVQFEDEIDGYPTPNPVAIKGGDRSLTTEEIDSYVSKVDSLYAYAVAHSLSEGADCTDMLVNASCADGLTGWTNGKSTTIGVGSGSLEAYYGNYSNGFLFDVYQDVKDVPDGIYSIACSAFFRPGGNGSYTGDETSTIVLYMNDFTTPVQNIMTSALPEDQAINANNSDDNTQWNSYYSTAWDTDYLSANGYVPNSMIGAKYAFQGGRYVQKAYGLVSGGNMRIGVKNETATSAQLWVLWSNFKLTYEGKSAEALSAILPLYTEQLSGYFEENADNMTTPMTTEIENVLTQADDAIASGDGDQMYTALENVNATYTAAKANVAATTDFLAALESASAAYETSENESAKAEYDAIYAEAADYIDFTTDKLTSYTEKLNTVASKLKVPAEAGDWTSLIVNPDFSEGTADGWTYAFAAITNIGYQGANYTNSEDGTTISQFIEGWRSGNAAIGDGAIKQTIGYLPAASYTLGVDAIANLQSITDDSWQEKVTGVYLYASQNGVELGSVEIKTDNGVPQHFTLDFSVATEGAVEIGIKTVSATANWLAADNWTLTCTSFDPTAIATVNATATNAAAGIYSVSGARISKVQKGINIVKMSDGTVKKVMVK